MKMKVRQAFSQAFRRNTIRRRLWTGFMALMALVAGAGFVGWRSLRMMSSVTDATLSAVQEESRIAASLSNGISREIQEGVHYVESRDSAAQAEFRRLGWEAHRTQRLLNSRPGQSAHEVALVAKIDDKLSALEATYARAHRLADLGRGDASRAIAEAGRPMVDALLADIDSLGQVKARNVALASAKLRRETARQSVTLVVVIGGAFLLALAVVVTTVRSIYDPLRVLVAHARELSHGNLAVRTTAPMPGEFETLAAAMNQTGESLSKVVVVAASTADDVSGSAHDLASVAEQISRTASQMAASMTDVSEGAESQVRQLREVDARLQRIRRSAGGVLDGAGDVRTLAGTIEESARAKRVELGRALGILTDVRTTVQAASEEVVTLNRTAERINDFVGSVGRVAEQTNLLALNAAIEAARAGEAGRGFAVVAEEVRKLAEEARRAADDVVQLTAVVAQSVARTTKAMEAGVARVGEIERVSRDVDAALTTISAAAERTRDAASAVTGAAEENVQAVEGAAEGITSIARTAEGHAAAAQQVSAATQEQSAACEQMSAASTQLLEGSTELRGLVGGLKTG